MAKAKKKQKLKAGSKPALIPFPIAEHTAQRIAFKDDKKNKTLLVMDVILVDGELKLLVKNTKGTRSRNITMRIYDHSGVLADDAELELEDAANPDDFATFEISSVKESAQARIKDKQKLESLKAVDSMLKDVKVKTGKISKEVKAKAKEKLKTVTEELPPADEAVGYSERTYVDEDGKTHEVRRLVGKEPNLQQIPRRKAPLKEGDAVAIGHGEKKLQGTFVRTREKDDKLLIKYKASGKLIWTTAELVYDAPTETTTPELVEGDRVMVTRDDGEFEAVFVNTRDKDDKLLLRYTEPKKLIWTSPELVTVLEKEKTTPAAPKSVVKRKVQGSRVKKTA